MGSRCLVGTGLRRREMFSSTMLLSTTMLLTFTSIVVESKELERFSRKGKVVSQEEDGNIAIELRRKRWQGEKERSLCCALSSHHCKGPCNGASCTAQCTLWLPCFLEVFSAHLLRCQPFPVHGSLHMREWGHPGRHQVLHVQRRI